MPPERVTGIYGVFVMLLEKEKRVKDSFDNLYQEEPCTRWNYMFKLIREDIWPRNCLVSLVFVLFFWSRITQFGGI